MGKGLYKYGGEGEGVKVELKERVEESRKLTAGWGRGGDVISVGS